MTISLEYIADCIRQAGCKPTYQLKAYLETGNECYITQTGDACYITRTGNARSLIGSIRKEDIRKYLQETASVISAL